MTIFTKSYIPDIPPETDAGITEQFRKLELEGEEINKQGQNKQTVIEEIQEKQKVERERLRGVFLQEILPKIKERIQIIAKNLRLTLQISKGLSVNEVILQEKAR